MKSGVCVKCGSRRVLAGARALDRTRNFTRDLTVEVQRNPQAAIFKGRVRSSVRAWICADCGYTELYADDPGLLDVARP